jgi:hypothetical protein
LSLKAAISNFFPIALQPNQCQIKSHKPKKSHLGVRWDSIKFISGQKKRYL